MDGRFTCETMEVLKYRVEKWKDGTHARKNRHVEGWIDETTGV